METRVRVLDLERDAPLSTLVSVPLSDVTGARLDPAGLVAFAGRHLADVKVPQYVALRADPLPRNAGGKVLKPDRAR